MTTPNDDLNGSTPPHILALALGGQLAAAAGGDTTLDVGEAQAAVIAAYTPAEAAQEPAAASAEAPAAEATPKVAPKA